MGGKTRPMKRIFITIYILLLIGFATILFGVGPIMEKIFEDESHKADQELAKGTFYLIAEKLTGLDEEGQKKEIKRLQPHFGYPVGLYKIDGFEIEEKYQDDLQNGVIVWEDKKHIAAQRLPDSDLVITMGGPFPGDSLSSRSTVIFLVLFFLFLMGPALLWTFFVNRDIRKIEKAAGRFSSGDHSSRVKVSRISPMTLIAAAFNTMAEKSQNLLTSQKELGNSVSHEIRTPLSRIKFSLQMLQDSESPGFQDNQYISRIGKDVEEIESLVDEMLTYARFDREPDTIESLPKNEMIFWLKTIIYSEEKAFTDKRIRFNTHPLTERFVMRFEPIYLGWAVRNLVRNAFKYATSHVEVTFEAGSEICAIHVDDDGQGIPAGAGDKIFEPFFRLDGSRNKSSGGYGLGLAIAKRIAEWHKGSISVDKSPFRGARFTLYLPVTS